MDKLYQHFLNSSGVCTDTRKITPGCIFFALKGDNFNGNQFAAKALEAGAGFAVVDDSEVANGPHYILVEDVLSTLQGLATYHRLQFKAPVIGITGSNGKTTTKELIREVLAQKFNVQATVGNLNNHIGVPLTMLSLESDTEIAIIEMGANHLREIAELCKICLPDFGIITNIGKAHIEGFGSYEGIKKTKGELYQHIRDNGGMLFRNSDDKVLAELAQDLPSSNYGIDTGTVRGKLVKNSPFVSFSWQTDTVNSETIDTQLVGVYNLTNMLAAVTIGNHFEVSPEQIKKALENYLPSNNRSQVVKTKANTLILDAYNANPTSMTAALENFAAMDGDGKFLILGDMLELGHESSTEHQNIVELASSLGLNDGILVGAEFKSIDQDQFPCFDSTTEAIKHLEKASLKEALILIKGSRGIRLEATQEIL